MFKGSLIFVGGIFVGYGMAVRAQEPNGEIKAASAEFIRSMKSVLLDAWLDVKIEMREAKEKVKQDAEEKPDEEPQTE